MQKQLREKLERLHELAGIVWEGDGGAEVFAELAEMRALTALMLAEPDRNCDVGTAEEQLKRHGEWCTRRPATTHPCLDRGWCRKCFVEWTQMPYEKGEKK